MLRPEPDTVFSHRVCASAPKTWMGTVRPWCSDVYHVLLHHESRLCYEEPLSDIAIEAVKPVNGVLLLKWLKHQDIGEVLTRGPKHCPPIVGINSTGTFYKISCEPGAMPLHQ